MQKKWEKNWRRALWKGLILNKNGRGALTYSHNLLAKDNGEVDWRNQRSSNKGVCCRGVISDFKTFTLLIKSFGICTDLAAILLTSNNTSASEHFNSERRWKMINMNCVPISSKISWKLHQTTTKASTWTFEHRSSLGNWGTNSSIQRGLLNVKSHSKFVPWRGRFNNTGFAYVV